MGRSRVSLQNLVNFDEIKAYYAIPCGQSPLICSGNVGAESRWTTSAYDDFLDLRRKLMAQKIKTWFGGL